ncbi:MAG: FtsQ-type POTRA domain-containing protein [Actinomycetota bacterium]|nr:FtsQ-type POTRA domain-containing protein [Actinomycetota bacterium]MDH4352464.1 FtsQ-type POTRA domain-containing protein [Actinomycetota bacterium]
MRRPEGLRLPAWWRTRGVAAVALTALAVSAWLLFWSPVLSVRDVEVTGTQTISDQQVVDAAAVDAGTPLARLDVGAVADRVRSLSAVADVTVVRAWPNALHIDVTERTALAVVRTADGYGLLGDDGTVFRAVSRPQPGLPFVDQTVADATTDPAAQAALAVALELPAALSAKVAAISADHEDAIVVRLRSGATVDWGTAEQTARKAQVLLLLLPQRADHYVVSAPETPAATG